MNIDFFERYGVQNVHFVTFNVEAEQVNVSVSNCLVDGVKWNAVHFHLRPHRLVRTQRDA